MLDKSGYLKYANSIDYFCSSNRDSSIGCDGSGRPVEIRPAPSHIANVDRHCANIDALLNRIGVKINKNMKGEYTLWAGCGVYPHGFESIGGHIHFGANHLLVNKCESNKKNAEKLVRTLDNYLIPLQSLLIPPKDNERRFKNHYGKLSKYREQDYGIEYRTPYCFVISPFFTKAWFSLASLIAKNFKQLKMDHKLHEKVIQYYDTPDLKPLRDIYPDVKKGILTMMRYNSPNEELNKNIVPLFNLIEQKKFYNSYDVLKNYGYDKIKDSNHKDIIVNIHLRGLLRDDTKLIKKFKREGISVFKTNFRKINTKSDIILYSVEKTKWFGSYINISPAVYKIYKWERLWFNSNRLNYSDITVPVLRKKTKHIYTIGVSKPLIYRINEGIYGWNEFVNFIHQVRRGIEGYVQNIH